MNRITGQSKRTFDTSISKEFRTMSKMTGLLPPREESFENQILRCESQLDSKNSDLERYIHLSQIRVSQTDTFYRLLSSNIQKYTPLIYTPTVGLACQKWSQIYTEPEGLYLPVTAKGNLKECISNWPAKDVQICVVTDGGRVLGLGDLGIGGLGISIGKLSLYTACAGIHPQKTLPIVIDFGTNTQSILDDPFYLGLKQRRVNDKTQEEFMEEFMTEITLKYPKIVVQFEDFNSVNAFKWLERFRHRYSCFNDDIQGTGAVILAGFIKAVKLSGIPADKHRIVFHGAGVAMMLSKWIEKEANISEEEAKKCIWLGDSKGLVYQSRGDELADHKVYFARNEKFDLETVNSLEKVLDFVKPTCLIGLCTVGGVFTAEILKKMGEMNKLPIIMPLSNPIKNAECTFIDAIEHTLGKVIFASGSPFPKMEYKGKMLNPGQGNNMYIFPGLGLGAILSNATRITEEMVFTASETLAQQVTQKETDDGMIYPNLDRIREVSLKIAVAVIKTAAKDGHGTIPECKNLDAYVLENMYDPYYKSTDGSKATAKFE